MTNRERVNWFLACSIAFKQRADRSKRPVVHIKIIGAGVFLGLPA